MNRTQEEQILLDEKIARIRKKNEEILRRRQIIEEEIQYFKAQNAIINSKLSSESEVNFGPTLYADSTHESSRSQVIIDIEHLADEKSFPSNERNIENKNDDEEWRAERNRIDEERIRRQRNNSGWRREWDANKVNDKYELDKYETLHYSQDDNKPKMQNISPGRPKMRNNEKKGNRNLNLYDTVENLAFETKRISDSSNTCKDSKSRVIKTVSWVSDDNLAVEDTVYVVDNPKNIVVHIGNSENVSKRRSIEITDKRRSLTVSGVSSTHLTDLESEYVKTCVAKTLNSNCLPIRLDYEKKEASKSKRQSSDLRDFSSTVNLKPTVLKRVIYNNPSLKNFVPALKSTVPNNVNLKKNFSMEKEKKITYSDGEYELKDVQVNALNKRVVAGKSIPQKEINSNKISTRKTEYAVNVNPDNDEEWEDASDGEWEDVSGDE